MRLYIAGPFYSPYHRAFHEANVRALRAAGHLCFVPQEHVPGIEVARRRGVGFDAHQARARFHLSMIGVRGAHAVVALLDDPDVSSGTACEMGIFYELARQDPARAGILGLLTDERPRRRDVSNVGESINFFTLGCVVKEGAIYESITPIITHLARWEAELTEAGHLPAPASAATAYFH